MRTATSQRVGVAELLTRVRATYGASQRQLWLVAVVMLAAFTIVIYLSFLNAQKPGSVPQPWSIAVLRLIISLLGMAAAYRSILTTQRNVWKIDRCTWRFAGGTAVVTAMAAGVLLLSQMWVSEVLAATGAGAEAARTVKAIVFTVVAVAVSLAFLRTQPWLAALAIGRPEVTLRSSWEATMGKSAALVGAWAVLALPPMIIHAMIGLAAARSAPLGWHHAALAFADAVVIVALAMGTALLNATAFRWVVGEQIPGFVPDGRNGQSRG